jgi:hypothetical protein
MVLKQKLEPPREEKIRQYSKALPCPTERFPGKMSPKRNKGMAHPRLGLMQSTIPLLSSKAWRTKRRQKCLAGPAENAVEVHITIMIGDGVGRINIDRDHDQQKIYGDGGKGVMMNMPSMAGHGTVIGAVGGTKTNSSGGRLARKSMMILFYSKFTTDMLQG